MIIKENHFHQDGLYIGPCLDLMQEDVRIVACPAHFIRIPYPFRLRGDFVVEANAGLRVSGYIYADNIKLRWGCDSAEWIRARGNIKSGGCLYAAKSIEARRDIDAKSNAIGAGLAISAGGLLSAGRVTAGQSIYAGRINTDFLHATLSIVVDGHLSAAHIVVERLRAGSVEAKTICTALTKEPTRPSIFVKHPIHKGTNVLRGIVEVEPSDDEPDPEPEALTPDEIKLVRRLIGRLKAGAER